MKKKKMIKLKIARLEKDINQDNEKYREQPG